MLKLIYCSLRALELDKIPDRLIRCIYELKMLHISGLCPTLERLVSGTGSYSFAKDLSAGSRKAFRYVTEAPVEKLFSFSLSEEVLEEFGYVTARLLKQSTDREFKSEALLKEL